MCAPLLRGGGPLAVTRSPLSAVRCDCFAVYRPVLLADLRIASKGWGHIPCSNSFTLVQNKNFFKTE